MGAVTARAQLDDATSSQGALHGTVRLHGASISPSDVAIRVKPLVERKDLRQAADRDLEQNEPEGEHRQVATRLARISAVPGEPNALQFVIPHVTLGFPYRLGIQFHNKSVGKVVWRVTNEGLVKLPLPGTREVVPILVDGYVVTSEIEILRRGARGNANLWVGADNLDFNEPSAAVRTFRWRTSLAEVRKGRLQVSTRPLTVPLGDRPPNPCDTAGLILSSDFDVQRDGWTSLPSVDFHGLIFGTRSGEAALPGVDTRTLRELQMGAGLYVRAVPLDPSGAPICDAEQSGLVGMVVVANLGLAAQTAKLAQTPISLSEATYQAPNVSVHPKSDEICYRTITDTHYLDPKTVDLYSGAFVNPYYDVFNHYLWTSGKVPKGTVAPAGVFFCVYNGHSDSSWFDDFVGSIFDVITGLVDGVGEMVNFAANLVDKLKAAVVNVAAAGLSAVGVDCDDTCHSALEAGLEVGMVAMGLPPSVPNFDQLMNEGTDYLADMAAEQAGVPPEVAEALAQKGKDFVEAAAKDMKSKQAIPGLPDWLTPDVGLEPAVLTLYLSGPGYDIGTQPGLIRNLDPIFLGSGLVKLPRQFGATPPLRLPMVLQPNLDGLPTFAPDCYQLFGQKLCTPSDEYTVARWNKQHWVTQRLNGGCAQFYSIVLAPPPALVYKLFSANVQANATPFPFWDGFANCSP